VRTNVRVRAKHGDYMTLTQTRRCVCSTRPRGTSIEPS